MNVHDIQSGSTATPTLVTLKSQRAASAPEEGTRGTAGQVVNPVGTFVSKPAEFFKRLQELVTADPPKAQGMLSEMAEQLRAEAQAAGPGHRGDALGVLASRFEKAAQTGDLSHIKDAPPPPQGAGRVSRAYASNQEPHALLELLNHEMPHVGTPARAVKAG